MKESTLEKLVKIIGAEKVVELLTEKVSDLETENFLLGIRNEDMKKENESLKAENERLNGLLTPTAKGAENE